MAYYIFKSSDSVNPFIIINEQTQDSVSTSINFVGKKRVDYGESQQQNQLWLLENFASASQPNNPVTGQLWYDTANGSLKVYTGTGFVRVGNVIVSPSGPTTPTSGQLWFNNLTQQLNCWNGSQWVIIGPTDDSIVYAIVFGG